MQAKNFSVLMIGLLVLGFLIAPHTVLWGPAEAQAQGTPIIQFVDPAGIPRYNDDADPIDPAIVIDVEVDFPDASTPCSGAPLPVDWTTLEVKVHRQLDAAKLETWDDIDESTWVWDAPTYKNVTGQVTIGGATSGQNRSLYGIEVCISNASARGCATKPVRVEHPVSDLQNNIYEARAISFSQSVGCGLIDPGLIGIINNMMKDTVFGVFVPSATEITTHADDDVNFTLIPLLGSMDMTASLNAGTNNVDLAPVTVTGVDLGGITGLPPGYNCELSGSGDGILYGPVSPGEDLDGEIRVYDITTTTGSGSGECLRDATGCVLTIKFDGNSLL
jgi:hypothetical protein